MEQSNNNAYTNAQGVDGDAMPNFAGLDWVLDPQAYANGYYYDRYWEIPKREDSESEEEWLERCGTMLLRHSSYQFANRLRETRNGIEEYMRVVNQEATPESSNPTPWSGSKALGGTTGSSTIPYHNTFYESVNRQLGRFSEQRMNVQVRMKGPHIESRVDDLRERLLLERDFMPIDGALFPEVYEPTLGAQELEQQYGSLEAYLQNGYADFYEDLCRDVLLDWMNGDNCVTGSTRVSFRQFQYYMYRYFLMTGRADFVAELDVNELEVKCPVVNPATFVYDFNSKADIIQNGNFYLHAFYLTRDAIRQQFPDVSEEKLDDVLHSKMGYNSYGGVNNILNRTVDPVQNSNAGEYLVIRCVFKVIDEKANKEKFKSLLPKIQKDGEYEAKEEDFQTYSRMERVYEVYMLGAYTMLKGGEVPYSVRHPMTPHKAHTGSVSVSRDNGISLNAPNKVQRLRLLQNMKNIAMFRLQRMIMTMRGDVPILNLSAFPKREGETDEQALWRNLKMIDNNNFAVAKVNEMEGAENLFVGHGKIGAGADEIRELMLVIENLTQQINGYLGENPTVQGEAGRYQTATNTMNNQLVAELNKMFDEVLYREGMELHLENVLHLQLVSIYQQLARVKEQGDTLGYRSLLARLGDKVELIGPELLMDQRRVSITYSQNSVEQRQQLLEIMNMSLQQGADPQVLDSALTILELTNSTDTNEELYARIRKQVKQQIVDSEARQERARQQQVAGQQQILQQQAALQEQADMRRAQMGQSGAAPAASSGPAMPSTRMASLPGDEDARQ